jgi:hypothetical protein
MTNDNMKDDTDSYPKKNSHLIKHLDGSKAVACDVSHCHRVSLVRRGMRFHALAIIRTTAFVNRHDNALHHPLQSPRTSTARSVIMSQNCHRGGTDANCFSLQNLTVDEAWVLFQNG